MPFCKQGGGGLDDGGASQKRLGGILAGVNAARDSQVGPDPSVEQGDPAQRHTQLGRAV